MTNFPALPGFYKAVFLHLEPVTTILPAVLALTWNGVEPFHHDLVPSRTPALPSGFLEPRTSIAIWQLVNCYFLFGLVSCLVFRAVRDAVPHDPVAQERIVGAVLMVFGIGDVTHAVATFINLPDDVRYSFTAWNSMTHANITFATVICSVRIAWFMGIGRTRYYYGRKDSSKHERR